MLSWYLLFSIYNVPLFFWGGGIATSFLLKERVLYFVDSGVQHDFL